MFWPGRLIEDNIIDAHEEFHYLKSQKQEKASCCPKLDFNKAYEKIEWAFPQEVRGVQKNPKTGNPNQWDRVFNYNTG